MNCPAAKTFEKHKPPKEVHVNHHRFVIHYVNRSHAQERIQYQKQDEEKSNKMLVFSEVFCYKGIRGKNQVSNRKRKSKKLKKYWIEKPITNGVGRKPTKVKVDRPDERKQPWAMRKMPKTINSDKKTGEKILKALKESLDENSELPRNATAHYEKILEKMGYKKWRITAEKRLKQLQRTINRPKSDSEFRNKFDSILPPTVRTVN